MVLENYMAEDVVVPTMFQNLYNYRTGSFLEYLSLESSTDVSELTLYKNIELWKLITKIYIAQENLELNLELNWYELFTSLSYEQFQNKLETNRDFVSSIVQWKILIWFINKLNNIVIVTQKYIMADKIEHILVN